MSTNYTLNANGGSIADAGNWSPSGGPPALYDWGFIADLNSGHSASNPLGVSGFCLGLTASTLDDYAGFQFYGASYISEGAVFNATGGSWSLALVGDDGTNYLCLYGDTVRPQLLLDRATMTGFLVTAAALYFGSDPNTSVKAFGPLIHNADLIFLDDDSSITYAAPTVFTWSGYNQPAQIEPQFDIEIALPHVGIDRVFQWRISCTTEDGTSIAPKSIHVVPYRASGVETHTPITLTPDAIDPSTFTFSFTPAAAHWSPGDQGQIYVVYRTFNATYDGVIDKRVKYGFTVDNLCADVLGQVEVLEARLGTPATNHTVAGDAGTAAAITIPTPPSANDNATAVWGATTRTLSSFGTLAADVWASTTRSLTTFGTLTNDTATAVWASTTRSLTTFGTLVADTATAAAAAILVTPANKISVNPSGQVSISNTIPTPPSASDNATATATAILVTPANKLTTDSSGRIKLDPTDTTALTVAANLDAKVSTIQGGVAAAVWDLAGKIDGKTPTQALKIISAIVAGMSTSADNVTTFKGLDGATARVVVTADESGNWLDVSYD